MTATTAKSFAIEKATRHVTIDGGRTYYDYRFGRLLGIGELPPARGGFVGSTIAGQRGNPTIAAQRRRRVDP